MALTKCPECGKQVSTNAETCPHCGNPLKEKVKEPTFKPNPKRVDTSWVETYKAKRKKYVLIQVLVGLLFLGPGIACFACLKNVNSYDNPGGFYALLIVGAISAAVGLILPLTSFLGYRTTTREVDGYTVLVYVGFAKVYVLVDNELKATGGTFKRSIFVTLDNGRQVTAHVSAWDNSVNISIDN